MSQVSDAIEAVENAGSKGLTGDELTLVMGMNLHQCANLLSKAHKVQAVYRLAIRRNNQKVYVTEQYLNGKAHQPYGFGGSRIKLRGTWAEIAQKQNTKSSPRLELVPSEISPIVLFQDSHFTLTWRP